MLIFDRTKPDRDGSDFTMNIWTTCGQHFHGRADTPARAALQAAALACAAEAEAMQNAPVVAIEVAA